MESFIRIYDKALPASWCRNIIDKFDADDMYHTYGMVSSPNGEIVDSQNKQTTEIHVSDHKDWGYIDDILYKNLSYYFDIYTSDLGDIFTCSASKINDQPYRVKKYDTGCGFNWHIDTSSINNRGRWIAAQWYFNTVYQGGETEFMNCGTAIRPVAGRLVFFPATWTYMHRSVPVYSGPKYICSTFFSPCWD